MSWLYLVPRPIIRAYKVVSQRSPTGLRSGFSKLEALEERRLLSATIVIPPTPVSGGLVADMRLNFSTTTEAELAAIQVFGPNGYNQPAVFESYATGSHGGVDAIYEVDAPSGATWSGSDDGYYNVTESTGTGTASAVGNFAVNIPNGDTTPPTAILGRTATLTATGKTGYSFAVVYNDNTAVLESTLFGVVTITGPGHFGETAITLTPSIVNYGKEIIADYTAQAPSFGGATWSAIDNGAYFVNIRANTVSDLAGNKLAGGLIGSFQVDIPAAVSTTPPTATLTAGPILNRSRTAEVVSVTYKDSVAVNGRTISSSNLMVIGRHSYSEPVTLANVAGRANAIIASYLFAIPPAGGYVVEMEANQVSDTSRLFVAAGPLDTFTSPSLTPAIATASDQPISAMLDAESGAVHFGASGSLFNSAAPILDPDDAQERLG